MYEPTQEQIKDYQCFCNHTIIEPDDRYNQLRPQFLTSSGLKVFKKNADDFRADQKGEIVQVQTKAMYEGSITHKVVLEGRDAFFRDYTVDAPQNKDGQSYSFTSQKFQNAQADALVGEKCLARIEDYEQALVLKKAVDRHRQAKVLLKNGVAERVVRLEFMGLNCQIKMDLITPYGIIDLKTCADIDGFFTRYGQCDVVKYSYLHSAAFYRLILHALAPDIPKQDFYFVAVEKKMPYHVRVYKVPEGTLLKFEGIVVKQLIKLKSCYDSGIWPDRYADVIDIDL